MTKHHSKVLEGEEVGAGPINKYFTGTIKETVCTLLFCSFNFLKLIIKYYFL